MKRLILALSILVAAAGVAGALHKRDVQYRQQAELQAQALATETQSLAEARSRYSQVTDQVRGLKEAMKAARADAGAAGTGRLDDGAPGSSHLTPDQSERLLAELGFNWSTTGDYLIVSKDTLREISVSGMRGARLDPTACAVLAITPDERASIESNTQALIDQYRSWAQEHIRREEPAGDIVAKYSLAQDRDFSLSLSNSFASGVFSVLGNERGNLLLDYSSTWLNDLGLGGGGDSVLTLKRYLSGDEPHLSFTLDYSGNRMSTDVSPYQEFPEAFLPLFPGGWPDLAKREGFALPSSFTKNP